MLFQAFFFFFIIFFLLATTTNSKHLIFVVEFVQINLTYVFARIYYS